MTYMWQEERGKKYYRYQTDEKAIADKMKRRHKFELVGWGDNCELWVFQAIFSRPDIAKKAFKTLTGCKIEFDDREEVFLSAGILSSLQIKAA